VFSCNIHIGIIITPQHLSKLKVILRNICLYKYTDGLSNNNELLKCILPASGCKYKKNVHYNIILFGYNMLNQRAKNKNNTVKYQHNYHCNRLEYEINTH